METIKLFWQDSYMKECSAKIISINENEIILDQSIIFSFSGGQESDLGWINEYQVIDSRIVNDLIIYTIDDKHNLKVNDKVELKIDWKRRYSIMKNHLAIELIHLLLIEKYPDIEKLGAHVAENKSRLDYVYEGNISDEFEYLREKINEIIEKDIKVIKGFIDEENQTRFWQVKGFDKVLCGGTHIASTKELGKIHIKRKNGGSNKARIEVWCE